MGILDGLNEDACSFDAPERGIGVWDMINMDTLTEQTILENIHVRYNKDIIYVCDSKPCDTYTREHRCTPKQTAHSHRYTYTCTSTCTLPITCHTNADKRWQHSCCCESLSSASYLYCRCSSVLSNLFPFSKAATSYLRKSARLHSLPPLPSLSQSHYSNRFNNTDDNVTFRVFLILHITT